MNFQEIQEWIKQARQIDCIEDGYDKCTNWSETRIYEVEGDPQLYALNFNNGRVSEKMGERGYIRDVYEPYAVIRLRDVYEQSRYEEGEGVGRDTLIRMADARHKVSCSGCGREIVIEVASAGGHSESVLRCCPFCLGTELA